MASGQSQVGLLLGCELDGSPRPSPGELPGHRAPEREEAPARGPGRAVSQSRRRRGPVASPSPAGWAAAPSGLGPETGARAAR